MKICAKVPIPDFNTLYNAALPAFKIPFKVPLLPSLPSPIYANIKIPQYELLQIIQELQSYQFMTTFMAILTPIKKFLGLSLSAILPKIPGTDLTLIDLLALTPTKIYKAIKTALLKFGPTIFPVVPIPIYYAVDVPAFQIITTIKAAIKGYMNTLITFIADLIGEVIKKLNIPHMPGLPALPVIPTMAVIMQMILKQLPQIPGLPQVPPILTVPSLTTMLNKFSLNALLARVVIPGFPAFPALLDPLIPNLKMPELTLMEGINMLYAHLLSIPMTIIMNFCIKTLSMLGFKFPTICITI